MTSVCSHMIPSHVPPYPIISVVGREHHGERAVWVGQLGLQGVGFLQQGRVVPATLDVQPHVAILNTSHFIQQSTSHISLKYLLKT